MNAVGAALAEIWNAIISMPFSVFALGLHITLGSVILKNITVQSLQRQIVSWVTIGVSTLVPSFFIPMGAGAIAMIGPVIAIATLIAVAWRHKHSEMSTIGFTTLLILLGVISAMPAILTIVLGGASA